MNVQGWNEMNSKAPERENVSLLCTRIYLKLHERSSPARPTTSSFSKRLFSLFALLCGNEQITLGYYPIQHHSRAALQDALNKPHLFLNCQVKWLLSWCGTERETTSFSESIGSLDDHQRATRQSFLIAEKIHRSLYVNTPTWSHVTW